MTREEFIEILEEKDYPYELEWNKIVVTHGKGIELESLETLPSGVEFRNRGYVELPSLKTLPPGVEFKNEGYVFLGALETLPPGVGFNNDESVYLESLKTIPPGVEFNNGKDVHLKFLIGGWLGGWTGNIKGISPNMLLNKMIADGVFDRR